ncbi:MAG: squalene synthase HpnC [Rhodospirillales bacterium]|nr:squalene synthase HpnC [Rhodospirillales bacterium]
MDEQKSTLLSGKTAKDENFPVGSFLLPARLRPHVAAYYRFARTADDIADHPTLPSADKVAGLKAMGEALKTGIATTAESEAAIPLKASLALTGVDPRHALDLLIAFTRDSVRNRTHSWDDLIEYCRYSAMPVGRFLLDLHGEDPKAVWPASDALCAALQILNHLQDLQKDYRDLDRAYPPEDWMAEEGARFEDLAGSALTPALARVVRRMLDATGRLIDEARPLPARIRHRGMRMEAAVIVALCGRLHRRLERQDPLAGRVKLTKPDFLGCGLVGVVRGFFG